MIMSYILNALRKAEKERQQKQEQNLSSQLQEAKTVTAHKAMPWLILLLSVNTVFLGYLFLKSDDAGLGNDPDMKAESQLVGGVQKPTTKHSPSPDSPSSLETRFDQQKQASQIAAIEQQPERATVSSPAIQLTEEIKTEKEMFGADELIPEEDINFNKGPTDAEMSKLMKRSVVSAPKLRAPDAQQPVKPENSEAGESAPKKMISSEKAITSAPALKSPAPERVARSKAAPITRNESTIPWLHDLPRDFRRLVPEIHINVYVYNDQPENRFIMIDMKKYKTGQEISSGMILQEIQADGIVVRFRGKRFRIRRG